MLAAALQQGGKIGHTALAMHASALLTLDREDGIFHQELHRCTSSPSQTDPPSVFL